MIVGQTLLLALGAAGVGTFVYWIGLKVLGAQWVWVCRWIGLAVALMIMAAGPIQIGK